MDKKILSFVCGFMLGHGNTKVILIKKERDADHTGDTRPKSLAGKLNGIGGLVLPDEHPLDAMVRKMEQEAGIVTERDQWSYLCYKTGTTPEGVPFEVHFLKAQAADMEQLYSLRTMRDEEVVMAATNAIQTLAVAPDLLWLIPMALDPSGITAYAFEQTEDGISSAMLVMAGALKSWSEGKLPHGGTLVIGDHGDKAKQVRSIRGMPAGLTEKGYGDAGDAFVVFDDPMGRGATTGDALPQPKESLNIQISDTTGQGSVTEGGEKQVGGGLSNMENPGASQTASTPVSENGSETGQIGAQTTAATESIATSNTGAGIASNAGAGGTIAKPESATAKEVKTGGRTTRS